MGRKKEGGWRKRLESMVWLLLGGRRVDDLDEFSDQSLVSAEGCQCRSQLDFCVPSQCSLLIFREFEEGLAKSPDLLADELRLFPRVSRLLELQEKRVVLEALHQVSGPSFVSASACYRAEEPCSLFCVDAAEPAPALPARSYFAHSSCHVFSEITTYASDNYALCEGLGVRNSMRENSLGVRNDLGRFY